MARRKKYRKILDGEIQKLRLFMIEERERRQEFKEHHIYLPSNFCPSLNHQVQELRLDGHATEIDFPSFADIVV